jgi:DNA repair exonuclease SbcCD nuclease subunit
MKIAFATDFHLRYTAPISRTDDDRYFQNILTKIKYLIDFANSNCDLIIFGGDIFDKPDIPYSLLISFIKELKKSQKPILSIIGNHDIYGYNGDSINKSAIGVLFENKIIKKIDNIIFENEKIRIKGIHCFSDLILDDYKEGYYNIAIIHKPITNQPIPNTIKINDIADKNKYNLLLCGDIHQPFEYIHGNFIILNPGSLSRTSIIDKDRDVGFYYINIQDNKVKFEIIKVPFERDVFSTSISTIDDKNKDFISTYAQTIYNIKNSEKSIVEYLKEYFKAKQIDQKIQDTINFYFQKAEGLDELEAKDGD